VAYNLTPSFINGSQERTDNFRIDPKVKNNPVGSGDYSGSGYDRGHLCPAGDMKLNLTSMSETFYMSNMSPQDPSFNRGIWETLESRVRTWAIEKNGVYVVTGPILKNICGSIKNGTISVPCSYYKIIFKDNGTEKIAIALILNNQGSSSGLKSFATSIDNIESLTGIDFFSGLSDDIENKLESTINTSSWSW
jgi:endonuclease G